MNGIIPAIRSRWLTIVLLASCVGMIEPATRAFNRAPETLGPTRQLAQQRLLLDVTQAGQRLIAVGDRSHILYSDDAGRHWQAARTPVQVLLTAVHFPTASLGWAVGHEGVILHTRDGGLTWQQQLNGHQANQLSLLAMNQRLATVDQQLSTAAALEAVEFLLEDARAFAQEGATRPLLDVWFSTPTQGIAVGAFGLILATHDGGRTWQSLQGQLDNPDGYHLNAITGLGDTLFIAGEAGLAYRSSDGGSHWERLQVPYDGSLFGIVAQGQTLVTFGLRGHLFCSFDQGQQWQPVPTQTERTWMGGALSGSGQLFVVGQNGLMVSSDQHCQQPRLTQHPQGLSLNGVLPSQETGNLTLVGQGGISHLAISPSEKQL
jgi:photosystem II stability/assembly factor-like uncharacterized protein